MLADNQYVHSLPPFANDENKALSQRIKELETQLEQLNSQQVDNTNRAESMTAHLKNVQQELSHTQNLYDAKNRQIETEEHLKALAERQISRLSLDIKRYETDIQSITQQLNSLQANIYKGNEKIDIIKQEMKMESKELEEWTRVQQEKDNDNLALQSYSEKDEQKIKELLLNIEKLQLNTNRKRSQLAQQMTETQASMIELDRTTEHFKQLHQERQELIVKWEDAVKQMNKRDTDIQTLQQEYADQKKEIESTREVINDKERFLEQQNEMNSELEKSISLAERSLGKFREQQMEALQDLQEFRDEVEALRNTLGKSATDIVNKKSELDHLREALAERQVKLSQAYKEHEELKKKLYELDDKNLTMEAKAAKLAELLAKDEARDKELDYSIKLARGQQIKTSQRLFNLRQDEKNLGAEILGGEASIKNLESKIHTLDQQVLKLRGIIYSMEFQTQQLEKKIRRAQGELSDDEKQTLLKRVQELTDELNRATEKQTALKNQLKRSQDDLRHAKKHLEDMEKKKQHLSTTIHELTIYNENTMKQLNQKVKTREDLMVEENILKLQRQKLRGFLNAKADEVFSLESRKVQLQIAVQERNKEIEIHKDMLRFQMKTAEEERHSAASELRDRIGQVEKLKKRYEIVMSMFAPEDGEEHSQAYYVIKAAQKKEELQREGDELDAAIRKAEKEIKALENTLKLMNDRNEGFRSYLHKAELDANDLQHREMLEIEYKQAMENYKTKRQIIQDLQQDLSQLELEFKAVSNQETSRLEAIQMLQGKIDQMNNEIRDQTLKTERAKKLMHKTSKNVQLPIQDLQLRQMKDVGTIVLTELSRLSGKIPDFNFEGALQAHEIAPPSRTVSRVSSRASSVYSDVSFKNVRSYPLPKAPTTVKSIPSIKDVRESVKRSLNTIGSPNQWSVVGTPFQASNVASQNLGETVDLPYDGSSRASSRNSKVSKASSKE